MNTYNVVDDSTIAFCKIFVDPQYSTELVKMLLYIFLYSVYCPTGGCNTPSAILPKSVRRGSRILMCALVLL